MCCVVSLLTFLDAYKALHLTINVVASFRFSLLKQIGLGVEEAYCMFLVNTGLTGYNITFAGEKRLDIYVG
jgi:hypothetical protein